MGMANYKERLMDEFESRDDEWSFADFERRLGEVRRGASYHDAKTIINDAHDSGRWPRAVKRYLLTNYRAHGNVSSELVGAIRQVLESMDDDEKESWGVG